MMNDELINNTDTIAIRQAIHAAIGWAMKKDFDLLFSVVARDGEVLLGQYASMPVRLHWGGREVRSSWGMDVFLREVHFPGVFLRSVFPANVTFITPVTAIASAVFATSTFPVIVMF